jgi:hypothetical protein
MTKRPGATFDNGFIFKKNKLKIKSKREKKSCWPFWEKSHLSTFIHLDKYLDGARGTL